MPAEPIEPETFAFNDLVRRVCEDEHIPRDVADVLLADLEAGTAALTGLVRSLEIIDVDPAH